MGLAEFVCAALGMGCALFLWAIFARRWGASHVHVGPVVRVGRSVGVFLQVGGFEGFSDLAMCTENVVKAAHLPQQGLGKGAKVTVDVSVAIASSVNEDDSRWIRDWASTLERNNEGVREVIVLRLPNLGLDVGLFSAQLARWREEREGGTWKEQAHDYSYILKIHTKSDSVWRERAVEALCGSPWQVQSAWLHFETHPSTALVAPLGTSFGPRTGKDRLFPHIRRKYWGTTVKPGAAFDAATIRLMHTLDRLLLYRSPDTHDESLWKQREAELEQKLSIVAGTCWWARGTDRMFFRDLPRHASALSQQFQSEYQENGGVEHALERLIPSRLRAEGKEIAELQPAPKVMAFYFPQFHPIEENNRLWGEGFTEWTLLNSTNIPDLRLRYPMPWREGGLGWYNLLDVDVRRRQAELAKAHGIHGFVIYHYWGLGGVGRAVMPKVAEAILEDGEPNIPFFFSWANEPWVRSWSGIPNDDSDHNPAGGEVLLDQVYGDKSDWEAHFDWLVRFFAHPAYVRVGDMPCIAIYRIGHMGDLFEPMVAVWRERAVSVHGFLGLHVITTLGGFRSLDADTHRLELTSAVDAGLHFWPAYWGHEQRNHRDRGLDQAPASLTQLSAGRLPTQYWGACMSFDRAPRTGSRTPRAMAYPRSTPSAFRDALSRSFEALGKISDREVRQNLYFITAWNEWNEQCTLEPDGAFEGMGYLQAVRDALGRVPAIVVNFGDN